MKRLNVPQELKGPWDSLLILTFGAQLDFFENALARQLADRCRNRVILCDGAQYHEICDQVLRSPGFVRHMNQRYLVAGVSGPSGCAHAKCVLLVNREEGRLLVGSGNLTLQGYARGHELFTRYEYKPESPDRLAEFAAVRRAVDRMGELGWFQPEALSQIREMWERAPWIRASTASDSAVRTNLETPFIDQFVELVGGEPVDVLHVMAAFHDEREAALERLLEQLAPQLCRIYYQPEQTSADPDALSAVLSRWGGQTEVIAYSAKGAKGAESYCHAKVFVADTSARSVCLQGSANLSQVALLRSASSGNFEMANLLVGGRGEYGHVFETLQLKKPSTDLAKLKLALRRDETEQKRSDVWTLTAAAADGDRLTVYTSGEPPAKEFYALTVGDQRFLMRLQTATGERLVFLVDAALRPAFDIPLALRLVWLDAGGGEHTSNSVVVCNVGRLQRTIDARVASRSAQAFGGLELNDEEIEQLVVEMAAGLLQDKADAFRVAAATRPASRPQEPGAPATALDEIDWDAVRSSHRYQQYLSGRHAVHSQGSLLSALLGSINSQFRGIVTPASEAALEVGISVLVDPKLVEEEERADGLDEAAAVGQSELIQRREEERGRHLWAVLRNFINRFVAGTFDPIFSLQMGPEVVVKNYRVMLHLLTLLLDRTATRPEFDSEFLVRTTDEFVVTMLLQYLPRLEPPYDADAQKLLEENTAVAGTLVALALAAGVSERIGATELLRKTRDALREALESEMLPLDRRVRSEMSEALPQVGKTLRSMSEGLECLARAANWGTSADLRGRVAAALGIHPSALLFERSQLSRDGETMNTSSLLLSGSGLRPTREQLLAGLAEWARANKADLYRISLPGAPTAYGERRLELFYDPATKTVEYWDGRIPAVELKAPASQWDERLASLQKPNE